MLKEGDERTVRSKLKEKKKIPDAEIEEFFDAQQHVDEDDDDVDERSFWDYMREREFVRLHTHLSLSHSRD